MAIIRRVTRIANPRRTKTRRKAVKARRTRKHRVVTKNPVLLEFGVLNPRKKRSNSVAKPKKQRKYHKPRRHVVAGAERRRQREKNPRHRRRANTRMRYFRRNRR